MEQVVTRSSIESLFNPSSIALVGASPDQSRPATRALQALLRGGSDVRIYPINPKYDSVEGVPCFEDLAALPEVPDVVVVAVRAESVFETILEASDRGTRAFIVFSSGFAEVGGGGQGEEQRLIDLATERDLVVLGPNSLGLINNVNKVWASFSSVLEQTEPILSGKIALITQSGAIGAYVCAMAQSKGFGFSHIVSTGNEAGLEAADAASYLLRQPEVDAVAMYLEGIRSGSRFVECSKLAVELGKRLIVLRAGDSAEGRSAAKSHTGAMTGSSRVSDAVFRDYGVIRVISPEDLVTACELVQSSAPLTGRRIGILTVSGGGGVLVADSIARSGLELPALSSATKDRLSAALPGWAAIGNPTDVTATILLGESPALTQSILAMSEDPGIDHVVAFMGAGGASAAASAQHFADAAEQLKKTFVLVWLGIPPEAEAVLRERGVMFFRGIEECIRPLAACVTSGAVTAVSEPPRDSVTHSATAAALDVLSQAGGDVLNEVESKTAIEALGITALPARVATTIADLKVRLPEISASIGFPSVVKLVAREVTHKNAIGAVVVGVEDSVALMNAADAVNTAGLKAVGEKGVEGILIERMAEPGMEVIIGAVFDPTFGYALMIGPGGILAELIDDITIVLPPASSAAIRKQIEGTRLERILIGSGTSAAPKFDIDALCAIAGTLASFLADVGDGAVKEIDMNPVIVHQNGSGATVVDCLISR